jgi:hypothetical protein
VPVGQQLAPPIDHSPDYSWDGSTLTVTKAGANIKNLQFAGRIVVAAANVKMQFIRVRSATDAKTTNVVQVDYNNPAAYLTMEDSEVDGGNNPGCDELVDYSQFTLIRDNLHSCGDGTHPNGNAVILDTWIHDLDGCCGNHNDDVQLTEGSNVTVRHNRLDNANGENSSILIGADQGPISNVDIEDNLLNGGGFTYQGGDRGRVSNVTFTNNHFLRMPEAGAYFPRCGSFGPSTAASNNAWSGNVWDDTGGTMTN